jgi:hypothetical protein
MSIEKYLETGLCDRTIGPFISCHVVYVTNTYIWYGAHAMVVPAHMSMGSGPCGDVPGSSASSRSSAPPVSGTARMRRWIFGSTAAAVTTIVCGPWLVRPAVRLVSFVHPTVAVSVDSAHVGWFEKRPRIEGLRVRDKMSKVVVFETESIRADRSLFGVMGDALRGRDRGVNIFVSSPRVSAYDISAVTNAESVTLDSPFSAEMSLDDRAHVFISDGRITLERALAGLLDGRLFVDIVKKGEDFALESDAPGIHIEGTIRHLSRQRAVQFVSPLAVTAQINQSFVNVFSHAS